MHGIMHHLVGIALALAAFGVFGRGIVKRSKGKRFNPLPAFLLILVAVGYHLFGGDSAIEKLYALLMDFGAGMMIASLYLAVNKVQARLFWVPGLLSVLMGGGLFVADKAYNLIKQSSEVELLVELGPDDSIEEIESLLNDFDASYEKAFPMVDLSENEDLAQYYVVRVCKDLQKKLEEALRADKENIDQFDLNHPMKLIEPEQEESEAFKGGRFLANDPYLTEQWFAESLNYNATHDFLKGKKPKRKAKVAIVDTGVDSKHEDLSAVYKKSGTVGDKDFHSHGTHCAGLAGAATNNGKGVGSLNYDGKFIEITGYPALDRYGRGSDLSVSRAVIKAAEGGADVISMSLGGYAPRPPKSHVDAINYARKLGAIVVVAAGNSNANAKLYSPANIDGVITVAAVDENLNRAVFSNTNDELKMPIAAPGVNCLSSIPSSGYQKYSGTSMATPVVSGLVGVLRSFNPKLSTEEAYKILVETGKEVNHSPKIGKVVMPLPAIQAVQ